MVKILRLLSAILLVPFVSTFAQEMSVSAYTDTTSYMVGDYITYTIEIKHDKYFVVTPPPVKDSIKVLDFIRTLPVEKNDVNENIIEYHRFIFSKYDSGKVEIPSLQVAYTKHQSGNKHFIATNPLSIVVHTLPVNSQEDIRDIKEPVKLPLDWVLIIIIVLIAVALAVGGYYVYRFYKKKKVDVVHTEPEIKIPPHEIALQQLHLLEERKLWQQGFVKEYHSEITEIIRKYFEDRFNFRALEMTSAEILAVINYIEDAKVITEILNGFFSNADLVKFAKFQPMPNVNDEMIKQAYQIVNDTIPKPVVAEVREVQNV
ncbi:MAG: hypothetical protein AB1521_01950 [Bacteroidota bacterium]